MNKYFPKDLKGTRYSDSRAMRDMMKNDTVSGVLSGYRKKQKFFEIVKDVSGGSAVTVKTMRTVLARCRWEERILDRKQSLTLARSVGVQSVSRTELRRCEKDPEQTKGISSVTQNRSFFHKLGHLPEKAVILEGGEERIRLLNHFRKPSDSIEATKSSIISTPKPTTEKKRSWFFER